MPTTFATNGSGDWARRFLVNATFFFTIFCFFRVFPFSAAEIQPIGAVFAALLLLISGRIYQPVVVLYVGVLLVYLVLGIAQGMVNGKPSIAVSLETFLAVLAPVVTCLALLGNLHLISARLFLVCLYTWFAVGFSQTFLPELQRALGLDQLLEAVVARYSAVPLTELGGRGATLLSPEPSYAAHTIFLFLVFTVFLRRTNQITAKQSVLAGLGIASMVLFNHSATVALIGTLLLLGWMTFGLIRGSIYRTVKIGVAIATAILVLGIFVDWTSFRFVEVGEALVHAVTQGDIDPLAFANQFGSVRTISVSVAYAALPDNLFGHSLGAWSFRFLDLLEIVGLTTTGVTWYVDLGEELNIKPYAHTALLAMDAGMVGVALNILLLRHIVHRAGGLASVWPDPWALAVVVLSLISICFHTPVSLPVYWVTLLAGIEAARRRALHDRRMRLVNLPKLSQQQPRPA